MSDDELEYEDVEDDYDDDEDFIDRDAADDTDPLAKRLGGGERVNPFTSGGGSSPFGSPRPSGGSPFTSGGGSPFTSGARPGGGSSPFNTPRSSGVGGDDKKDEAASGSRLSFGGGSSRPAASNPFRDRDEDKGDSSPRPGSGPPSRSTFGSGSSGPPQRSGGASSSFGGGSPRPSSSSPFNRSGDDKKDDDSGSSRGFSFSPRPASPSSGGDSSARASSGSGSRPGSTGGTGNLPGRSSSPGFTRPGAPAGDDKKDDKATDKKPDDDKEDKKAGPGERLSGLRNRFGGNPFSRGKPDDGDDKKAPADKKKDDKGDDKSGGGAAGAIGGALGSIGSRLPFGGRGKGDDDKADKKDDAKPAGSGFPGSKPGGVSGGAASSGGFRSQSGAKPTAPGGDKKPGGGAPFGASGGKGLKPSTEGDKKGAGAKQDDKAEKAEGGGLGARISAMMPSFGRGEAKEEKKPASKTVRQSKAPKVQKGEGLSLDRKLDILGVGLVIVSGAMLLSRLSPNQGVLTEGINRFFSELFGWGAIAVPIAMFAVGMWLIIRHFGENAPTIDTERIIGLVIIYITLLVLFQFVRALNYPQITSFSDLELQTRLSWEVYGDGGGYIGGNLYLLMVQYLGEVLAFAVVLFGLIVGVMFVLDVSVSEVALITIGLFRSFRAAQKRSNQRKAIRKAERLARRQEQVAELSARAAAIDVSRPAAPPLPAGEAERALPAPGGEERSIPITMGGRTVEAPLSPGAQPLSAEVAPAEISDKERRSSSGLFGRLLNRGGDKNQAEPTAQIISNAAKSDSNGSSPLGGLMNRLPFGGGSSADEKDAKPAEGPNAGAIAAGVVGAAAVAAVNAAQSSPQQPAAGQPPAAPPPPSLPGENPTASAPPSSVPPSPGQKVSPFGDAPLGKPAQQPNQADGIFENKRISQVMETVKPEDVEQAETPSPTNGDQQPPVTRADRLNAIRQGEGGHPASGAPAPANGGHSSASAPPPAGAAPPFANPFTTTGTNGAAESSDKPTTNGTHDKPVDIGKTDAYGNSPTPAAMQTPAQMRPAPGTPPGASPTPSIQREWRLPDIAELLNEGSEQDFDRQFLVEQARIIEETLRSFGAPGRVVEINTGPVITQYGVEPDYLTARSGKKSRVKVSAIAQLDRDLQLALGARSIRIEAPVPGKGYVGIEIPNAENALVSLKDVMQSDQFQKLKKKSKLTIALGQSVDGTPIAADLSSMPHLLIAGTTGSGKSVCVNAIISSLLANNTPEELKFIMVDPKRVELTGYNGTPHLVAPVVVELERIVGVLKWVTREMDERYKRFSQAGARNIEDFNKHLGGEDTRMPYIVVIIDELADLMMLAPEETERTITRIAALARATGIHLVIATQRPSVDVVTGLIKANFPARIAFAVAGSVDSRVILDQPGAERLLGRGDMLYLSGNSPAPQRLQGVFLSDEEIDNITRYWKTQSVGMKPGLVKGMAPMTLDPASAPRQMTPSGVGEGSPFAAPPALEGASTAQPSFWDTGLSSGDSSGGDNGDIEDEMYEEAVEVVRKLNKASVSLLQRRLRIGYTRASRLIDLMEERGIVGPQESGSKPREVLPE